MARNQACAARACRGARAETRAMTPPKGRKGDRGVAAPVGLRARQCAAFRRKRMERQGSPRRAYRPVFIFDKLKCHKSHFDNGYMLAYTGSAGYNTVNAEAVAR